LSKRKSFQKNMENTLESYMTLIQNQLSNCVNQALRKGSIGLISFEIQKVRDNIFLELKEFRYKEALERFCQSLKGQYETEFQKKIDSEGFKCVKEFFIQQGLPEDAIYILLSKGITTMAMVNRLKSNSAFKESIKREFNNDDWFGVLEDALSGSNIEKFKATVSGVTQNSLSLCNQQKEQVKDAIKEVEALKEKVEKTDNKAQAKDQKEIDEQLKLLNDKLAPMKMTLRLADMNEIEDLLSKLNDQTIVIESIKQTGAAELSVSQLIKKNGMLRGYLWRPEGIFESTEEVIQLSSDIAHDETELKSYVSTVNKFELVSSSYDSAAQYESTESLVEIGGRNWGGDLNSAKLFGLGGIALSAKIEKAKSSEESKQEGTNEAKHFYTQTKKIFYSKDQISIPRKKLRLSDGALKDLEKILRTSGQEQKDLLCRFHKNYGSHVMVSVVFGGYYELRGSAHDFTQANFTDIQNAVSEKLNMAVGAAVRFLSVEVGGSLNFSKSKSKREKKSESSQNTNSQVDLTVNAKGGAPNTPFSTWACTLEFNTSWVAIERKLQQAIPIWEILDNHEDLSKDEIQQMQVLLDEISMLEVLENQRDHSQEQMEVFLKKYFSGEGCCFETQIYRVPNVISNNPDYIQAESAGAFLFDTHKAGLPTLCHMISGERHPTWGKEIRVEQNSFSLYYRNEIDLRMLYDEWHYSDLVQKLIFIVVKYDSNVSFMLQQLTRRIRDLSWIISLHDERGLIKHTIALISHWDLCKNPHFEKKEIGEKFKNDCANIIFYSKYNPPSSIPKLICNCLFDSI